MDDHSQVQFFNLTIYITTLSIDKKIKVGGNYDIGSVMLKLVEELGKSMIKKQFNPCTSVNVVQKYSIHHSYIIFPQ